MTPTSERFVAGQNVVVADGKIVSVGDDMLPKLPPGARVIDGAGKTLVPGLWDSHMHVSDDFNVLSEVALGVTSVRNPGGQHGAGGSPGQASRQQAVCWRPERSIR